MVHESSTVFCYLSATITVLNRGLPGERIYDLSADLLLSNMAQEDPDLALVQALKRWRRSGTKRVDGSAPGRVISFRVASCTQRSGRMELATETFVRAYFNIEKFRPAAKFATWLYQIALNLCRDHLRSRAYQDSLQTVSFDAPHAGKWRPKFASGDGARARSKSGPSRGNRRSGKGYQ